MYSSDHPARKRPIVYWSALALALSSCANLPAPTQEERQRIRADMERLRTEQIQREQLKHYRKRDDKSE